MAGLMNPTKKDLTMFGPLPTNPDPNKAPPTPGVPIAPLLQQFLGSKGNEMDTAQGNELMRILQGINTTKK